MGGPILEAEYIPEGQTVTVNGQSFIGEMYVVRQMILKEISFVDLAADASLPRFWDDYKKLLELTGHQAGKFRGLGDPIDPSEDGPLGPLWPEQEQQLVDIEAEAEIEETPLIKVFFDESSGITEDEELLVLTYFNLLYQQQGQPGLIIVDDKRHIYEGVPYVV